MLTRVEIDKFVHGGQAIGIDSNGKKVLVWNALPGEVVDVRLTKSKSKFSEGIAQDIINKSKHRLEPKDESYLSTSPWQILPFKLENDYKHDILTETLKREKVNYDSEIEFVNTEIEWNYRNKMEYSFWADDNGLHLALYNRGTHQKQIVDGSSIANHNIDDTANKICTLLSRFSIRGSQLKTIVIRCDSSGDCSVALFVKDENFPVIEDLKNFAKGLVVYYSNPNSPASIISKELYRFGEIQLTDNVSGHEIKYDVNSFFQVNLPIFELALEDIKLFCKGESNIVDFYSGVGTIGITVGADIIVEIADNNIKLAKQNSNKVKIIKSSSENSTTYIPRNGTLIVDPPRAGLHRKLIVETLEILPENIVYLSCNPITFARDLKLLEPKYKIRKIKGYNFFPKTPHIEALAFLTKGV